MKKLLLLITAVILALSFTVSAFAEEKENTEYIFWDKEPYTEDETTKIIDHVVYKLCETEDEKYYEVYDWFDTIEATKTVEAINIAPEIDGIRVEKIQSAQISKNEEYRNNHNYIVKSVTIPDTITEIGGGFFTVLDAVEELVIPASVEKTGYTDGEFWQRYCFTDMENLRKVTFLGDIYRIGGFNGCKNLESVILEGDITVVDIVAFAGCTSLKTIDLPESLKSIEHNAFSESGLVSITIPSGVSFNNSYNDHVFDECRDLEEVIFAGSYKKFLCIPYGAFASCSSLKSVIFPKTCDTLRIDWWAFNSCFKLENLTLPKKCKSMTIGEEAFVLCKSLKTVTFPSQCDNLNIGLWAFRECKSLKTVSFPTTADTVIVGYKAFRGCTSLTNVKNTTHIEKIYGGAFRGCTSLKSFAISEKTAMIGKNAFYGCKNLKTVTVGCKSTPKIYTDAFAKTNSALAFTARSKTMATNLKKTLIKSGLKTAKVGYIQYV